MRLDALLLSVSIGACGAVTAPTASAQTCSEIQLRDVTDQAGIDFVHDRGTSGDKHLPETMGAGLAWLDFDGDGWQDVYLVQSGPFPPHGSAAVGSRLYRNLGDGRFEDVTKTAAADHGGNGQGALAADLDGDGAVDLLVTTFGTDRLLRNTGGGRFEPATETPLGEGWSSSAAAADGDGDGDLDLYVSRYVTYDPAAPIYCGEPDSGERRYCDPSIFEGARDRYFDNLGEGRFREVGEAIGLGTARGRGLGVLFTDLDGDRLPDIYVANDLTANGLYRNLGDGRFEDVSLVSGAGVNREGKPEAGMGVAVADHNGDLLPDLVVTNFDVETNTYYEATGELFFTDRSAASGFGTPSFNHLAFGVAAFDLEGDGDDDVYVANGHIFERPKRDNTTYRQRDQILLGDGHGRFEELECDWLEATVSVGRGLAGADIDNDGDVDLGLQDNGGAARLLRNDSRSRHWLGLVLRGAAPNTEAIGARVVLSADTHRQPRWVIAGDSYQSSSDRRPLFAWPGESEHRTLEIAWPRGGGVRLVQPPSNAYLVFEENER